MVDSSRGSKGKCVMLGREKEGRERERGRERRQGEEGSEEKRTEKKNLHSHFTGEVTKVK